MGFREACGHLNIRLPDRPIQYRRSPVADTKPAFIPETHDAPVDLWQEKAEKFVAWSQENLAQNGDILAWLAGRGINAETAAAYRLGWNPGEDGKDIYRARKGWGLQDIVRENGKPKVLWIPQGLVIPYIDDGAMLRIRIRRPEGAPRYYVIPGSAMHTMICGRDRRAFVVVESELDAIAVAANSVVSGAVAVGSASAKPDALACEILRGCLQILDALDYDSAGTRASAWWQENFDNCDRWPVPRGKDPGDAYRLGTDLEQWIKAGMPPVLTMEYARPSAQKPAAANDEQNIYPEGHKQMIQEPPPDLPALILELYVLLRKNPEVKIYHTSERFTCLRNGKYVGGRFSYLIFREPEVTEYLLNHPIEIIDWKNFLQGWNYGINANNVF
jgi:hypothetical protein